MTGALPLSTLDVLEMTHVIALTVLDDMRLVIEPQEIARDAEHNSATFRIVQQPALLDQYVCRAEVSTVQGTNHRLVVGGEFSLTNDIAVTGTGSLQLVYSDGEAVILKTYKVPFHVSASINAIDPSEPEFENGLAQITRAAFANAIADDSGIQFYNIADQPLDFVAWPPGSGEGLDEAMANLLYVRQDGTSVMSGDLRLVGSSADAPIGIMVGGRFAQLRWDNGMLLQKGQAGENVYVANNDGSGRSAVLTEVTGDQRYLREINANQLYCALDGTQMRGPFISQLGSSNTNLGVSVGDNSSGFWRTGLYLICVMGGQTVWQSSTTEMMIGVRLNAATQQITNVGDPTSAQDAVNRRTMDAAIAAVPRPVVPASRVFIPNEISIGTGPAQEFFNQPFFTNDNTARTILVTVYPQFAEGTPSAFYDLEYTTGLSAGLVERSTVYPTAQGYMGGGQAVAFAATVQPVSSQIQVSLSVRQMSANPGAIIQIGSRATQRSYVVIQEMTN